MVPHGPEEGLAAHPAHEPGVPGTGSSRWLHTELREQALCQVVEVGDVVHPMHQARHKGFKVPVKGCSSPLR